MADQIQFSIPDDDWVELIDIKDSGFIWHQGGSGTNSDSNVVFVRSDLKPAIDLNNTRRFKDNPVSLVLSSASGDFYSGVKKAWASSVSGTQLITVTPDAREIPSGVFAGLRAVTVQSYTEANAKIGVEHEGSTLLTGVTGLAENDTIFLTGSLSVALKQRTISYSGTGVTASIYEAPAYTGGTPAVYQNASNINPVTGLSQIIVGATVTDDGTLAFAPNHLLGSASQQGKGDVFAIPGSEKLLKPNTAYLFRLTSLDAMAQDISSFLSWYEGELDLPL